MSVISGGSTSRRELRHMIMRRRNERVTADRDATGLPRSLRMHPDTHRALLIDPDPDERFTLDFEGQQFLGIPIVTDPEIMLWVVEVDW